MPSIDGGIWPSVWSTGSFLMPVLDTLSWPLTAAHWPLRNHLGATHVFIVAGSLHN